MDAYCLVWTLANGQRQANSMGRERDLVESIARCMNREQGGTIYAALPLDQLETWKEQQMDIEAGARAEELMINSRGDPVPAQFVPGRVRLEDQTVNLLITKAVSMQQAMGDFKAEAFSDVHTFMAELSAAYGVDRAGKRGGVELTSFDGLRKVAISVADTLTFGPELEAAKALIDDCIMRWSADAKAELKVLVNDAFRIGATGKIRVDRVVGLRRLEIKDAGWQQAMVAISDALRVQGSVSYIRFYQRERQDEAWQHIPLDMSRL